MIDRREKIEAAVAAIDDLEGVAMWMSTCLALTAARLALAEALADQDDAA